MTETRARGWHPDPDDDKLLAFWDGRRWRRRGTTPAERAPGGSGGALRVLLALAVAFIVVSLVVYVLTALL